MSNDSNRYPRRGFLSRVAALPVIASIVAKWQPSVSFGQLAPGDPLVVPRLPEVELAREVESLMKLVDPRVAYRHTPIAPERNAWPLWKQAAETFVKESSDDEYEEAVGEFLENGQRPSEAILKRMTEWTRRNEPARRLTDEGIARGEYELPRAKASIRLSLSTEEVMKLRDLAQLKEVISRLSVWEGDLAPALREALSIVQMSRMMLRGESMLVDYLVAHAVFSIGVSAASVAAMAKQATVEQAKIVVRELAEVEPDDRFYRQAMRVELCRWFLPSIANAPTSNDAQSMATYLLLNDVRDAEFTDPQRTEYLRCIRDTTTILDGHPHLFDRDATARLASELHERMFEEMEKPRVQRDNNLLDSLGEELAAWPVHVDPDLWILAALGNNSDSISRPTRREIRAARDALRGVDNLVGKRMVLESLHLTQLDTVELTLARVAAWRLRIAISHYERQHGSLPTRLDDLVDDGWFPTVPLDPYDRQPFRYSAADRIIWSVGRDGTSDGPSKLRDESYDPEWEHLDNVWSIPSVPTG